ncbi:hypothetical protein GALMADRAFT_117961 [Galerina marginata CBS 339.88]|uniref:Arrestin-like N-terminal domain-containing protein n=1 Tax=Galerina marginata (strain CBS 339.88) TaxID=685588 RepID=A0A067T609_GALM3|nr:hypothetical protein GALMADRAFT_117961 [Galerina marginata CBS 339.88]
MASSQALPEPMNSSPHHSKVKVTITLADPTFVAGTHVSGKLEMECRADKGLGIGILMVELFALQELTSRDHSATSTFLHSRRLFQGPGLPPSNAVQAHPMPGDPHLPQHYYHARKGRSTFLFRIPIPVSSPSSISFGSGLARVRYELRASVGVYWKNEKRLVIDKHPIDVVEAYPYDEILGKIPEAIVVGENGKLWMQGRMVGVGGSIAVAGESACLELQVKNHSNKKNSGLTLTLTRTLYLAGATIGHHRPAPVQISDTLTTVPFRGPEYIIPPGAEGIANLVFDVPKHTRGARGGILDGEEGEGGSGPRHSESLFEIKCKVEVKLTMGMGSKDILLEIPIEIVHPRALPPTQQVPGPYAQPYSQELMVNQPPGPYAQYNPYNSSHPISPGPMLMPYVDPTQNQVWLPPPPHIPASHTPLGYPYASHSPLQAEAFQSPLQPYTMPQPFYGQHTPPHPQQNLHIPVDNPVGTAGYVPRPSSAGPVASASQVVQPIISGLPRPLPATSLIPLHDLSHSHTPAIDPFEPEVGKGERASRVTQHLRLSSRNRSVSPQSHRYPIPGQLPSVNESYVPDTSSIAATAGVSSNATAKPRQLRNLPPPPGLPRAENLSISPPVPEAVVHSPRPHLTPKHSFTRDPILGATVKSERVEELEKMADEVARKSEDLSCDLPKGVGEALAAHDAKGKAKELVSKTQIAENDSHVNKTLPGPPVPSGKNLLPPPSRTRADLYFADQSLPIPETSPLPSDQTPPTPALLAVLPSRRTDKNELKSESGLDALERRLLAEVGTRKADISHANKDQRPDLRNILPIDTTSGPRKSSSIPIPTKSPEPLHDSAISSLTLAGGLGGDDSDGEFDGRTHRAGRSRGGSSGEREGLNTGLHQHMRERAHVVGTPTRLLHREREAGDHEELDRGKEKEKGKEGKVSGRKKDRSSNKSAAKGRVAAWLGRIDPDIPPQEQVIPPSPSVIRNLPSPFEPADTDRHDEPLQSSTAAVQGVPLIGPATERQADISAAPNPRSSGFVPIATLKRDTLQARPLITRDATVVEEARRVQDIWSSEKTPVIQAKQMPQFLKAIPPAAAPVSIRTDRKFSPPSSKPPPPPAPDPRSKPLSYSAVARSAKKQPEVMKPPAVVLPPPSKTPVPSPPQNTQQPGRIQPVFPQPKPVDPEVKYDIRSARGGRGGKVTSVANLWSSGAITSHESKGKDVPKRLNPGAETRSPLPSQPLRAERKLFSTAVMTPPPKQVSVPSGSGLNASKPTEAQKRPDTRNDFPDSKPVSRPLPKKVSSAKALVPPVGRLGGIHVGKGSQSTDALVQKRPATAMSSPYSLHGKITPTNLSTPSSSEPRLHNFVAKGVKPVIKGTSDPAVVSSSHAVPTLSSTASLARPQSSAAQKHPRPVKLPTVLTTTVSASLPPEPPRPVSPSKPADLAFGQARLRDLIKKYQGQGQKT